MRCVVTAAALLVALATPIARAVDPMLVVGTAQSATAYNYDYGLIQANGAYSYVTGDVNPAWVAKVRG